MQSKFRRPAGAVLLVGRMQSSWPSSPAVMTQQGPQRVRTVIAIRSDMPLLLDQLATAVEVVDTSAPVKAQRRSGALIRQAAAVVRDLLGVLARGAGQHHQHEAHLAVEHRPPAAAISGLLVLRPEPPIGRIASAR
ncbi:hypothetical protein [Pseudonocardia sp. Ae717_Ps2]|uniref:hypothetical protein n=1 Tax=Pseudonocardia sp. Ae717_Ps2 TaxID=1885573 RepID=UPI000A43B7A8|nr:hypothetical protein [Pseudonocardia sp. Ae717_Ps2]